MDIADEVARVRGLSDQALLAGLSGALGFSREWVALLVVHLGEVEARRLHLLAGHGSTFVYCTDRLGMSEDEAFRRIEVARLARQFPVLFDRLASGAVSLSVATLLKPYLSELNCIALLDAVSGNTVKQAREVVAAWFPRPDVLPSIRKLPERRAGKSSCRSRGRSPVPSANLCFEWGSADAEKAKSKAGAHAGVSENLCKLTSAGDLTRSHQWISKMTQRPTSPSAIATGRF